MKKLMHLLFLSCLKATELIEKKLHVKLSFMERLQLKAHKMMCDACTNYEKQSIILDQAMHKSVNSENISINLKAFKKDILDKIEETK